MEKQIAIAALLVTAVLVAGAAGAPSGGGSGRRARSVDVQSAQGNRTLCPYTVEVDEDAERVPRRIRVMRCLPPHEHEHEPRHAHHRHRCEELTARGAQQQRGRCVELRDQVLVYYRGEAATRTYDVPVGCTCMFLDHEHSLDPELTVPAS